MDREILRQTALLHPDKIMQPYDAMMDLHGFDAICAFADFYGGLTIYVPSRRTIFSRCLEAEARKEFNGHNLPKISKKYGYSGRYLQRLIK